MSSTTMCSYHLGEVINMSEPLKFKPELWKPLVIPKDMCSLPEPTVYAPSLFVEDQTAEDTYEVRGILPRAQIAFREQD